VFSSFHPFFFFPSRNIYSMLIKSVVFLREMVCLYVTPSSLLLQNVWKSCGNHPPSFLLPSQLGRKRRLLSLLFSPSTHGIRDPKTIRGPENFKPFLLPKVDGGGGTPPSKHRQRNHPLFFFFSSFVGCVSGRHPGHPLPPSAGTVVVARFFSNQSHPRLPPLSFFGSR